MQLTLAEYNVLRRAAVDSQQRIKALEEKIEVLLKTVVDQKQRVKALEMKVDALEIKAWRK